MLNKFEIAGIGLSVLFMALALYLIRVETTILNINNDSKQNASVSDSKIVIVDEGEDVNSQREKALLEAFDAKKGSLESMVIDDILIGKGEEVKEGDTVVVDYIGTLQNGEEFDNSKKRGEPFTFKVGQGMVIAGWEKGIVGMKVGGQRILVIPPDLGYGDRGIGPIPPNSTLVFSIELLEIR